MKVTIVLALSLLALASGNPFAGKEWHWKPRHPTFSTNPRSVPLDKFVKPEKPLHFVKGTTKVENCGKAPTQSKIVGGTIAAPHAWPWQVALSIDNMFFCGGWLISDEWVLTAAHCTDGSSTIDVLMGAHDRSVNEPSQVTMTSTGANIITHENWGPLTVKNDIAAVRLPQPVTLSPEIQPACLPSLSDVDLAAGTLVTPTGWGKISDGIGGVVSELRQVTVPVISQVDCAAVYGSAIITDMIICTDGAGGMGTCNGDSGGPLNYDTTGAGDWCVRGIVSFGASAGCEAGFPAGFTRVLDYLAWIETNTGVVINP